MAKSRVPWPHWQLYLLLRVDRRIFSSTTNWPFGYGYELWVSRRGGCIGEWVALLSWYLRSQISHTGVSAGQESWKLCRKLPCLCWCNAVSHDWIIVQWRRCNMSVSMCLPCGGISRPSFLQQDYNYSWKWFCCFHSGQIGYLWSNSY